MAEEAQKRVQAEVNKFLTNLDQTCLRKMQVQMFQCSAKCCENNNASMEQVASCVEDCSSKFRKAQSYISNEMSGFLVSFFLFVCFRRKFFLIKIFFSTFT